MDSSRNAADPVGDYTYHRDVRRRIEPLGELEGLGINVRQVIPGHQTRSPSGLLRWLVAEDLVVEETPEGDFLLLDPELVDPVPIPRERIVEAAAQVANLIVAARHDARRAAQVIDDAILPDDDVTAAARTIANIALEGLGED